MTTDTISKSDCCNELLNAADSISTDEARDRLEDTLFSALESGENTLIDAPTSLGKSHIVATTPWREYPEVTGGKLVIHIHQTKDARDEAVDKSEAAEGVEYHVLKGREDCCRTAAGDYDDEITAPNGLAPSEWFEWMCDVRKIGFGKAHTKLDSVCDLPCTEHGDCQSFRQWWEQLRDEDGSPTVDVVHATANFAHVDELIDGANLIFDERPDYALTLRDEYRQQIRDSVSNLLRYRSDGEFKWSHIDTACTDDDSELQNELRELLNSEISREWFFAYEETHRLAPEIGLAILQAEEVLSHQKNGENGEKKFFRRWKGEHGGVEVLINGNGKLRHVRHCPDLSKARCVIGLDAFPSLYRWRLNTVDDLSQIDVLTPSQRRIWRQEERGLKIVQINDEAVRSYTRGWRGAGEERSAGLIEALRRKHGDTFRSCICADKIEDDVREQMKSAGIENPLTLHYGEQNSRNDFENEEVGLEVGCIDPGDKNILDLLALDNREAWPEWRITEEGNLERASGRTFLGPDADIATEILESVREANLAQGAGRYARKPDSPESSALVYVWSDACPPSLVDEKIDVSYLSLTQRRRRIIRALRDGCSTARELKDAIGGYKSDHIDALELFYQHDLVSKSEGTGKYGATEWEWLGGDLGETETHVELSW